MLSELQTGEFAPGAGEYSADGVSRRALLKVAGASLAVAAAAGCHDRPWDEVIVPPVDPPSGRTPGVPVAYSTAMPLSGYGRGVLAFTREGRPVKLEGNPDHPSSVGGSDVFLQASLWDLYDPGRSRAPMCAGQPTDWTAFWRELSEARGRGPVAVLTGAVTSPTLAGQLGEFERGGGRWHVFEPVSREGEREGARLAFGRALDAVYDLRTARVVVSLDNDFVFAEPGSLRYARDFIDGRRVRSEERGMNRLYAAEGNWTLTGSMADHRLLIRPSRVGELARALAAACGVGEAGGAAVDPAWERWVRAVADDLKGNRGAGLVVAGLWQPPEVHAAAHAINSAMGNVGTTVRFVEPVEVFPAGQDRGLAGLARALQAGEVGEVGTLMMMCPDPAGRAPVDTGFAAALEAMTRAGGMTVHLSGRPTRTSVLSRWALPESHYLEAWGDVRGHDGTASVIQPVVGRLHQSMSAVELMERLLGRADRSGLEAVRETWRGSAGSGDFEAWWTAQLARGTVEGSAGKAIDPGPARALPAVAGPTAGESVEVVVRPDYAVWDGTFAGNLWLQELPRPLSKLVWDNAITMSPGTATELGVGEGDVVRIAGGGQGDGVSVEGPVLVLPGMADGVAVVTMGYGADTPSGLDGPVGFDVCPLRTSATPWSFPGTRLTRTGRRHELVRTRSHHALTGATTGATGNSLDPQAVATTAVPEDRRETGNRTLVRVITLAEFHDNRGVVRELGGAKERKPLLSLYREWNYDEPYQWGMCIDQTACIGCNACVVACQAENNIAVVGKAEVARQREMHWIRIDDYLDPESGAVCHQPVTCMHCENAPCEYVCPVGATTHSPEGLNQMTYNRCVGTRYCSNNCPYKVRRFNFLDYRKFLSRDWDVPRNNPEVTIRTRGVMEKCTYCVQRIERTRVEVARQVMELRDRARGAAGDDERKRLQDESLRREADLVSRLQTACQQACPTRAIEFGSIRKVAGQETEVMRAKASPLDYVLLRELTTEPRTSYLARVRNPNPALAAAPAERGPA